jgi:hypothetical protein
MSILNLSEKQSLESLRKKVEEASQRPAYVASCCAKHGTHYKFPGEDGYRTDVNPVELFLSRLTDRGICVRHERDEEENKVYSYYELVPARTLRIVVPLMPREHKEDVRKHFEAAGLRVGLNTASVSFSQKKHQVPDELKPFVAQHKTGPLSCIWFAQSEAIDSPDEVRHSWHLGARMENFFTIQPPGQYSKGDAPAYHVENNGFAVANVEPGRCIVCHGESGERRHFGTWKQYNDSWMTSAVCLSCLRSSMQEWIGLLEKLQ